MEILNYLDVDGYSCGGFFYSALEGWLAVLPRVLRDSLTLRPMYITYTCDWRKQFPSLWNKIVTTFKN